MTVEIEVKEGEETEVPTTIVETAADVAGTVVDTAVVIADKIDEARKEGDKVNEEIVYTLHDIFSAVSHLGAVIAELKGQVEYLTDEIATLTALEVAAVIVEETPAKVEEIAAVADVIEEQIPEPSPAPAVSEPEKRVEKKSRKWL